MALRFRHLFCGADRTPIEVDQPPLRRHMRKDYAAAAPVAGGMRLGARCCIAHTILQRQGQGHTALPQVRFVAAAW